jgi:hypothetical protein
MAAAGSFDAAKVVGGPEYCAVAVPRKSQSNPGMAAVTSSVSWRETG